MQPRCDHQIVISEGENLRSSLFLSTITTATLSQVVGDQGAEIIV